MEVFPLATVLFNLTQFVFALIVFFPMALLFFKVSVALSWLNFFLILALHILFTLGLCFIVSTATVFYRDVRHFTEILLMLLFWLTPIIYDIQTIPASLRTAIYWNPLAYFILAYQDALYHNIISSFDKLIVLALLALVSVFLGYTVFVYTKFRFPEEV